MKKRLSPEVAAIMLTNPNTCGLFERDVVAIAEAVHAAGAYFYADGANFNAIVGKVRPGDLGVDAMHINLHKTFSTPHGGGGPGAGPVALSAALAPFMPVPYTIADADGVRYVEHADPHRPPPPCGERVRGGGGRTNVAVGCPPPLTPPRKGEGRRGWRPAPRPHVRLPRPDGHVRAGHGLHALPRLRRHAAGERGRRAQRQLRARRRSPT